jgi:hypothetical protein
MHWSCKQLLLGVSAAVVAPYAVFVVATTIAVAVVCSVLVNQPPLAAA